MGDPAATSHAELEDARVVGIDGVGTVTVDPDARIAVHGFVVATRTGETACEAAMHMEAVAKLLLRAAAEARAGISGGK